MSRAELDQTLLSHRFPPVTPIEQPLRRFGNFVSRRGGDVLWVYVSSSGLVTVKFGEASGATSVRTSVKRDLCTRTETFTLYIQALPDYAGATVQLNGAEVGRLAAAPWAVLEINDIVVGEHVVEIQHGETLLRRTIVHTRADGGFRREIIESAK